MYYKNFLVSNKKFILFLILVNVLIYYHSLFFDFVWDDVVHLDVFRERLKSFINLLDFFKGPNVVGQPHYYRPLMLVSYGIDYLLFKNNPFGYHLTSLLLHISNVILIFFIIDFIFKKRLIAFISAVLFSIHPVHSEAIVWISARADVLCSFFSLWSLYFYLKFNVNRKTIYSILSLVFFIFAVLTKEIALLLPVCYLIYDFYFQRKYKKNFVLYALAFLLIIIFLVIRAKILTIPFGDKFPIIYKISTIPLIFIKYLELLFFPLDLRILYYEPRIQASPNIMSFVGWVIIFIYLGLIYVFYKKNKELSFFLIFYILFLLPVIGVVTFIRVSLVGDRYLYFPSIGLFAFCSYWIYYLYQYLEAKSFIKYFYSIVLIAIFSILSILSYNRNKDWSEQLILLTKMQRDMPMYMPVYLHLGIYYFQKNDYEKALINLEIAKNLAGRDDKHIVHNNLGVVYSELGDFEKAEENFFLSFSYKSDYAKNYYNWAHLYFSFKYYDRCLEIIEKGLVFAENKPELYNLSAVCAYMTGDKQKAIYYINRAIEIEPDEGYKKNMELILSGKYNGQ